MRNSYGLWPILLGAIMLLWMTGCSSGGFTTAPDQQFSSQPATADQPIATPATDQPITAGPGVDQPDVDADVGSGDTNRTVSTEYNYRGNFSGDFYLPAWGGQSTIYWRPARLGTYTLSYKKKLVHPAAWIDCYYRGTSTRYAYVLFDQLTPSTWFKSRSVYCGGGDVSFKFVLHNSWYWGNTVVLKMQ